MHELERIEYTLANDDLDPAVFERCAQDLLTETYPGLSPVPGGTDWGRDADVHDGAESPPPRLMVTKSREFSGIRSNMIGGLESLKQHSVPFERIVIANLGTLNETQRSKLRREAATHGARLEAVYAAVSSQVASAATANGEGACWVCRETRSPLAGCLGGSQRAHGLNFPSLGEMRCSINFGRATKTSF